MKLIFLLLPMFLCGCVSTKSEVIEQLERSEAKKRDAYTRGDLGNDRIVNGSWVGSGVPPGNRIPF